MMVKEYIDNDVMIVCLSNGKANSINREMISDIKHIIKNVSNNSLVKGLVLTGEGKNFSLGADISSILKLKNDIEIFEYFSELEEVIYELFIYEKPIIAAINGHAIGAGLIFALCADYKITLHNELTKFGMPEIKIGMLLSPLMLEVIKFNIADNGIIRDMLYFGNLFDIKKAIELGVVDDILYEGNLIKKSIETIRLWLNNPSQTFSEIKNLIRKPYIESMYNKMKEKNFKIFADLIFSKDTRKAMLSI